MKKFQLNKILYLIVFIFFVSYSFARASSDGLNVNLHIGECNNNNICEKENEDFFTCPQDCTPVVVPPSDPNGGVSGSLVMDNVFNNLTVEVSYNSAIIKWKSSIPTMSNIKWGTSPDYKDGVLRNINYLVDHKVELTNLKEGTFYYFNIQAESYFGKTNSLENQVFRTLSLLDTTPPSNPTNVAGISTRSGITISWDNPKDEDFDYIRVMKNLDRFYGSPSIGYLVYEGDGKYFTDSDVLEGKKYYYSLFSRDRAGNYSSGALVSVMHNPTGKDTWGEILTPKEDILTTLEDKYIVIQEPMKYDFMIGNIFKLSGSAPITIKTNYHSNTKNDDFWVEIRNAERRIEWQYFFSRTRDADGYISVTIPSFEQGGYYSIKIYKYTNSILNYKAKLMNQGAFEISKVGEVESVNYSWFVLYILVILLFILLLLYLLYRLFRKMYKKIREREGVNN